MARQWIDPIGGVVVNEDGTEEYVVPVGGFVLQENQAAATGSKPPSALALAGVGT